MEHLDGTGSWNGPTLESLIADFGAHIARLGALDANEATAADVIAELRDNAYPSLVALAEEMRELDAAVAELDEDEESLDGESSIQIAAALGAGGDLAAAVSEMLPTIEDESKREFLSGLVDRFQASARVAVAVLHRIVTVDDESADE